MTELEKHYSVEEDQNVKKRRKLVSILSIIVFFVFFIIVFLVIGRKMIRFFSEPDKFRDWVDAKGVKSRFIFVGMMILQIIIAIIPGEPLEIGAGYAFGAIEGTILCLLGILIGSILVFLFSRYFG